MAKRTAKDAMIRDTYDTVLKRLQGADTPDEGMEIMDAIRRAMAEASPVKDQPVSSLRWVPIDMVEPNDYNPNSVARKEMRLLYLSILNDGYTQPVVTIWDEERGKFVIVDGFHRYFTCKNNPDILERNHGYLPIVVIQKDIKDRMASTVRHNRARGKHSVDGMANMVFKMLEDGWSDTEICNQLGMEPEELTRLKHVTGFSKLFANAEYKMAWETRRQIKVRLEYEKTKGAAHPVRQDYTPEAPAPARKRQRPA